MNQELLLRAAKLNKLHHRKDRVHRAASILSFVIVLCTVWSLMLPAITLNGEAVCGLEEHTHGDACYETRTVPACGLEESEGHTHTDECYAETEAYVCGLEESEGHAHTDACYTEQSTLSCGMEESEGHTHTDACYTEQSTLSCGLEETEGHTHTDSCWTETLICDNHDEEHIHDESCYTSELTCGLEESEGHAHTDSCYTTELVLTCELEESEGHVHTEACYTTEPVLSCGMEESEGHTHTDACLGTVQTLVCEIPESEGHTHSEACGTTEERVLVCDKPEHTHTDDCYPEASDNSADTETAAYWESTFANVTLTGNYAEDVLAIAKTQLGYHESTKNFQYDGSVKKGYTRYGAWYGDPYGDWCAMFVSFCLRYAGVPESVIPSSSVCNSWTVLLGQLGRFEKAGDYTPRPGDVIFFDTDGAGGLNATHVGLVAWVGETSLGTIEGNAGDCVCTNEYSLDSAVIYGYGRLGDKVEETVLTYTDSNINAELTVSPALDGEAELRVEKLDPVEDETLWKNMAAPVAEQMIEDEDEPETLDLYRFALLKNGEPLALTEDYKLTLDASLPAPVTDEEQEQPSESVQSFALSVLTEEERKALEEQEEAEQLQREDEEEINPVEALLAALMPEVEEKQEVINEEEKPLPALKAMKLAQSPTDDPEQAELSFDGDGMFYGFALASMPEAEPMMLTAPLLLGETPDEQKPFAAADVQYHKQIDWYGDAADDTKDAEKYRLYLDAGSVARQEPVDLLIVVDESTSMNNKMGDKRRDKAVSEILNGGVDAVTGQGLISKFLSLNNKNKVSVIAFYGDQPSGKIEKIEYSHDAKELLAWTDKTGWTGHAAIDCTCRDGLNSYTNYCAGYMMAQEELNKTAVASDGNKKLILFLSDGVPTYYLYKEEDGSYTRDGNGSPTDDTNTTNCANGTKPMFNEYIKNSFPGVPVYTIAIGSPGQTSFNTDVLNYMSTQTGGALYSATSYDGLLSTIEDIITGSSGTFRNLTISDRLSDYVDMAGNIRITSEKLGTTTLLYERETAVESFTDTSENIEDAGQKLIQSVSYDADTKTVTATFKTDVALDKFADYTLSFDVELTNLAISMYSNYQYNATGDKDTDASATITSSEKEGFYSNAKAKLSYKLGAENAETTTHDYPKPVVQVPTRTDSGGGTSADSPKPYIQQHKTIDWLGDKTETVNNTDTGLDDGSVTAKELKDFYRLYLDAGRMAISEPLDLLIVLDKSNSMNTEDITVPGQTEKIKRYEAVNNILNGTDDSGGLIRKFLNLNPDNRYAVVSFGGEVGGELTANNKELYYKAFKKGNSITRSYQTDSARETSRWTWDTTQAFDCTANSNWGTNYCAGLYRAIEMLNDETATDHRKVMVFISDGVPTFWMDDRNTRYGNGSDNDKTNQGVPYGSYSEDTFYNFSSSPTITSKTQNQTRTEAVIDELKTAFPKMDIYAIGVASAGSLDTTLLEYMCTGSANVLTSLNYDVLFGIFEDIIYGNIGDFKALSISDTLSDYVNLYEKDADIKVTMTLDNNNDVTLYSRETVPEGWAGDTAAGAGVTFNADYLKSVTYDAENKRIQVNFKDDLALERSSNYELSFNVQTTEQAYTEYEANVDGGEDGYKGVTGDAKTDFEVNTSSSLASGFHSNEEAHSDYKLGSLNYELPYHDPVIQVHKDDPTPPVTEPTLNITVRQQWIDVTPPDDTTVKVTLYQSTDDGKNLTPTQKDGKTVTYTLNKDNTPDAWSQTVTGLPLKDEAGKELTYYIIAEPVDPFRSSYDKPDTETVLDGEPVTSGKVTVRDPASEGDPYTGLAIVKSTAQIVLPNTGGSGTALFTGFGLALLALGAALAAKQTRTYKRERKINIKGKVTMKKALALLMTLVMILALGVTAFAADGNKITVPENDLNTYDVHQIFVGDYYDNETDNMSDDVLSNVKWGKNGTGKEGERVDKADILDKLEAINTPDKTDVQKLALILNYFKGDSVPFAQVSADEPLTNVPDGYYLIGDSANTALAQEGGKNAEAHTLYLIKVVGDIVVNRKNTGVPTVVKKIVENGKLVGYNNATKDDVVNFQITGTIPPDASVYDYYYYVFNDTLPDGLTFNPDSVKVAVDGADVPFTLYTGDDAGTYSFRVALNGAKAFAGKEAVVTYSATLNTAAKVWTAADQAFNRNRVFVSYSNDPNFKYFGTDTDKPGLPPESVSGVIADTPESKTYTFTAQLDLKKVDSKTGDPLTGASFTLKKGETVLDKDVAVDENGLASFKQLGAGVYTLVETVTPKGYNTCDPIEFEVVFEAKANSEKSFHIKQLDKTGEDDGTSMTLVVENVPGTVLPTTGGVGTTLFYVIGGLLVFGAAVLLITKKRMKAEK